MVDYERYSFMGIDMPKRRAHGKGRKLCAKKDLAGQQPRQLQWHLTHHLPQPLEGLDLPWSLVDPLCCGFKKVTCLVICRLSHPSVHASVPRLAETLSSKALEVFVKVSLRLPVQKKRA